MGLGVRDPEVIMKYLVRNKLKHLVLFVMLVDAPVLCGSVTVFENAVVAIIALVVMVAASVLAVVAY